MGKLGSPSLFQVTWESSSEMDQRVVVCEDLKLGAQKVVVELLGNQLFKGEEFQLHAGVVSLVFLHGTQLSTCVG